MSRLTAVWRQHRAHLALRRALAAQRTCCAGRCTTADQARRVR